MKNAEQVLDFVGGLIAEVHALAAYKAEVSSHLPALTAAIAGEPEATHDASVLAVAANVILRLRQERDEARQKPAEPPGYAEALRNARSISGVGEFDHCITRMLD